MRLSNQYADLAAEGLDAAIRVGHGTWRTPRSSRAVSTCSAWECTSAPAYFARRGRPGTPADLTQHECVIFRMPSSGRDRPWQLEERGRALELHPRARYPVNDGESLIALATASLALVQTPDSMARAALKEGVLAEVLQAYRPARCPSPSSTPARATSRCGCGSSSSTCWARAEAATPGERRAWRPSSTARRDANVALPGWCARLKLRALLAPAVGADAA